MTPFPHPIEDGVFDIPLQLDAALEPQQNQLRGLLLSAQKRLRDFALARGWGEHVRTPFAESAHIHATKAAFDLDLLTLCGLDPTMELPSTYCAALEQGVLLSVSPELYRALYPEGDETDAYEKLLTHEMAHHLHIRILGGDEEAMGPVWFYEGFALHAADQLRQSAPRLDESEIWAVVRAEERADYRQYVSVFDHFLGKAALPQLVDRAGKPDFIEWLEKLES
jgi:hypothetical protein